MGGGETSPSPFFSLFLDSLCAVLGAASDELVDSLKAQLVKLNKRVESCPKQVVKEAEVSFFLSFFFSFILLFDPSPSFTTGQGSEHDQGVHGP